MTSELFKVQGSTQGFCIICDHDLEDHEVLLEFEDGLPVVDNVGMMACAHMECTCNVPLRYDEQAKLTVQEMIKDRNDSN